MNFNTLQITAVCEEDGSKVHFQLKTTTPFKTVYRAYGEKQATNKHVFFYKGVLVSDNATPESLKMVDKDKIDVVINEDDDKDEEINILVLRDNDMFQYTIDIDCSLLSFLASHTNNLPNMLFLYNGVEINEDDTPTSLEMIDGAVIQMIIY